jgi:hypothetical protein
MCVPSPRTQSKRSSAGLLTKQSVMQQSIKGEEP